MNIKSLEKGDRRSLIKISCSRDLIKSGYLEDLIDGNTSNNRTWFLENITDGWIKFEFPQKVSIKEIIWYQHIESSQGLWRLMGSNDDNNYDMIQDNINLGNEATSKFTIKNNKKYMYYKLEIYEGETYNGPYTEEIEFKLVSSNYLICRNNDYYSLNEDKSNIVGCNDLSDICKENNNIDLTNIGKSIFDFISKDNYNIIKIVNKSFLS